MPDQMAKDKLVQRFDGKYAFLSNFYPRDMTWWGQTWPTVEHAYQAVKTTDPQGREQIRKVATPGMAKRLGRLVDLRDNWDEIRLAVMLDILRTKFGRDKTMRDLLLATEGMWLVEGNTWGDEFWGKTLNCTQGDNWLGRVLMIVRAELQWGNEFVRN